jgi:hypothetical protein
MRLTRRHRHLFPQGKVYASRAHLREEVREFADWEGFAAATDCTNICCTRSHEPISQAKARDKKNASGLVPVEKRRAYKSSMLCGCPLRITFTWMDSRSKDNTAVRVSAEQKSDLPPPVHCLIFGGCQRNVVAGDFRTCAVLSECFVQHHHSISDCADPWHVFFVKYRYTPIRRTF